MLTREQILAINDCDSKTLNVPGWRGDIKVRSLTIAEQMGYEKIHNEGSDKDKMMYFIITCCVDDEGKQLFSQDDVDALWAKSGKVIMPLYKEIVDFNSVAKDVEQQAKNS